MDENDVKRYFWIIFFIYLSVFVCSYVFFTDPFEFQFGYLVFIVLLPGFASRFGINRSLFFIFLTLLVTGLFQVALGNNTPQLFFKIFTGLALSYFFYYYVVLQFNYNIEQLFKWYLKGAYIASLIGIFQFVSFLVGFVPGFSYTWIFNKWGMVRGGNFGIRINSIFGEPSYLAAVLSAAFFVSVYNLLRKENFYLSKFQSIVIIVVYILSFSGLGQAGIFLSIIFLAVSFGLVRYIFILIPVAIITFNFLFNNVKEFRERYVSTVDLFTDGKFKLGKTHGSSFILYNNYLVATQNFKDNFLFGTGLGSHPIAFDKYSIADVIKAQGFDNNSADANSMFLRLLSETGLFGVSIFLFILIKSYVRRDENHPTSHWLISNAILIMILLNLFRQGHYFIHGFPFFIIMYYYNSVSYKNYLEESRLESINAASLS